MYTRRKKGSWYGMLETSKSNTVLIWDSTLPKAEPGKVYFYNTDRDAIIEYVEDIVKDKLRDLGDSELKEAKGRFKKKWLSAKSGFLKKRGVPASRPTAPKESNINEMLSDVNESDPIVDDEFEDL